MQKRIQSVLYEQEKYVLVWGVGEITYVSPTDQYEYKITASCAQDEDIINLHITLTHEQKEAIVFDLALGVVINNKTIQLLIDGAPLFFVGTDAPNQFTIHDLSDLMDVYGGMSICPGEATLSELKWFCHRFALH